MRKLLLTAAIIAAMPLAAQASNGVDYFLKGEQMHSTHIKPWQDMTERPAAVACNQREYFCTPLEWETEIAKLQGLPLGDKLLAASQWINKKYPYKRISFEWASPTDIEVNGRADCKDHAVAKMALLIAVGVPEGGMRVLVLEDMKHKFMHAVLMVETTEGLVYLDDQIDHLSLASEVPYYRPIYSINFDGWWLHDMAFEGK